LAVYPREGGCQLTRSGERERNQIVASKTYSVVQITGFTRIVNVGYQLFYLLTFYSWRIVSSGLLRGNFVGACSN
jgi:hypothetical protein